MPTYSELLRDPKWQRKRLEVLRRDDFTCQECGSTTKTLHVHHCYYERGRKPWDYPSSGLLTLCYECHEYETVSYGNDKSQHPFLRDLAEIGFTGLDMESLSYAFAGGEFSRTRKELRSIITNAVSNEQFYVSCLDLLGLSPRIGRDKGDG